MHKFSVSLSLARLEPKPPSYFNNFKSQGNARIQAPYLFALPLLGGLTKFAHLGQDFAGKERQGAHGILM